MSPSVQIFFTIPEQLEKKKSLVHGFSINISMKLNVNILYLELKSVCPVYFQRWWATHTYIRENKWKQKNINMNPKNKTRKS